MNSESVDMNLIKFHYFPRTLNFSEADRNGARIADGSLTNSALSRGIVDTVYVADDGHYEGFVDEAAGSQFTILHTSAMTSSTFDSFEAVALVSITQFARAALWRQHLPFTLPICALVHSIPSEQLIPLYLAALALARPYDRVVVSSSAGREAITNIFGQCATLLGGSHTAQSRIPIADLALPVEDRAYRCSDKHYARHMFGIPEDATVFLYFGRLTAGYKADLEPMIRAFADASERSNAVLLIAGHEQEHGYLKTIRECITLLALSHKVKIIPNSPDYVKEVIYAAADVFVAPSDNVQETYGLALVEAMLSSLPVIATDWSGHRDIVAHEETGFLVDTWIDNSEKSEMALMATLGREFKFEGYMAERTFFDVEGMCDAMRLFIEEPATQIRMGAAGRQRAKALFSADVLMPKFQSMWEEQLSQAKGSLQDYTRIDIPSAFASFSRSSRTLGDLKIIAATDGAINGEIPAPRYSELIKKKKATAQMRRSIKSGVSRLQ